MAITVPICFLMEVSMFVYHILEILQNTEHTSTLQATSYNYNHTLMLTITYPHALIVCRCGWMPNW